MDAFAIALSLLVLFGVILAPFRESSLRSSVSQCPSLPGSPAPSPETGEQKNHFIKAVCHSQREIPRCLNISAAAFGGELSIKN